jgi:Tol biopolymer transport system component
VALPIGARLGVYEITAQIGEGGMGQVYQATDTKLKRQVAIKMLPPSLAADADRLARFQREAEVLASLNHPNIAHIHGLEESGGITALVMELVEGDDLSQRIARGAIPVDEALPIAKQIAEALEAAHQHGIIHRDLKPANIKVREDGTVKVLDFGLAKALTPESGSAAAVHLAQSPTITSPAIVTGAGMILGTAAYMAPEQARGRTVDKRADVWAFGCVLYEMLTGRRAIEGDDVSDTLAAVLRADPDWTRLPDAVPSHVRSILRACLQKDPRQRMQAIGDVRLGLDGAFNVEVHPGTAGQRQPLRARLTSAVTPVAVGLLTGAVLTAAVGWWMVASARPAPEVARVLVGVSPADQLRGSPIDTDAVRLGHLSRTAFTLSPDGRTLVFSGVQGDRQQLYVRRLDQLEAAPLAGTDGGESPFFSPDGAWVGFWAGGALRKVPLSGGSATTLCETSTIFGASWGSSDLIVFARQRGGLWQVAADGGSPTPLTSLDVEQRDVSHRLPQLLPGNRGVLFTVTRNDFPNWDTTQVVVQPLPAGTRRVLIEGGADARYVRTGHLLYVRRGVLLAAPFDLEGLATAGGAVTVVSAVMQAANVPNVAADTGASQLSVSDGGSLAYLPGGIFQFPNHSIVWVNRAGAVEALPAVPQPYANAELSPDGTHVLVYTQGDRQVWLYNLARGTMTRLTTDGSNSAGIWTPDGERVTFASSIAGPENLYWRRVDGSGAIERLTTSTNNQLPAAWSPDGQVLALVSVGVEPGNVDIWVLRRGNAEATPLIQSRFNETHPAFSPDGRWLAYASNESGRLEVYVQAYPGPGSKMLISTEGGTAPSWRPDGRELFYNSPTGEAGIVRMMAVPVTLGSTITAGKPRLLFGGRFVGNAVAGNYDTTADGQRFLMIQREERPPITSTHIVLVQNWTEELKRLVPTR